MARSKPISGELFQLITAREASRISVVSSGGNSPNSAASVSHPSSNGSALARSNRTAGLSVAPRPRRAWAGIRTGGGGSGWPAPVSAATASRSNPLSPALSMAVPLVFRPQRANLSGPRQEHIGNIGAERRHPHPQRGRRPFRHSDRARPLARPVDRGGRRQHGRHAGDRRQPRRHGAALHARARIAACRGGGGGPRALALAPARRHAPRARLAGGGGAAHAGPGDEARLFPVPPGQRRSRRVAPGTAGRLALPGARPALRGPRTADLSRP